MFRPRIYDSLAGLLAAGLALGVAELVAALTSATSLITAVGNIVVDYTPGPLVKATIDALGTAAVQPQILRVIQALVPVCPDDVHHVFVELQLLYTGHRSRPALPGLLPLV